MAEPRAVPMLMSHSIAASAAPRFARFVVSLDRAPLPTIRDEVGRSRRLIEDKLSVASEGFAYPFGYWSRPVRPCVSAAGYSYACAVGEHVAAATADSLTLPRLTMAGGMDIDAFARLLDASSTPAARLSSEVKRWAWRAARRHVRSVGGDPQPLHDLLPDRLARCD